MARSRKRTSSEQQPALNLQLPTSESGASEPSQTDQVGRPSRGSEERTGPESARVALQVPPSMLNASRLLAVGADSSRSLLSTVMFAGAALFIGIYCTIKPPQTSFLLFGLVCAVAGTVYLVTYLCEYRRQRRLLESMQIVGLQRKGRQHRNR